MTKGGKAGFGPPFLAMNIKELREAVAKARRNAVRKRRRIEKSGNYVALESSKYYPVRPPKVHEKYNRRQLEVYLSKLQEFNSPKTQFVPDHENKPVPIGKWRKYKGVEAEYNRRVEEFSTKFDDKVKLKRGEVPPSHIHRMANPDHMAGNSSSNGAKRRYSRKSYQIRGEEKLDKLTKRLQDELSDKRFRKELGQNWTVVRDILYRYADDNGDDLIALFESLSAEQFEYFWHFSPAHVHELFLWYETVKAIDEGRDDLHDAYFELYESARENVADFMREVKNKVGGSKPARVNRWGYMQPSNSNKQKKNSKRIVRRRGSRK